MTQRKRRTVIAAACLTPIVVIALGVATATRDAGHDSHGPPPTAWTTMDANGRPTEKAQADAAELAVSGPETATGAVRLDGLPTARFIKRERPRALATARKFLKGYLAIEVDEGRRGAERQITATATRHVAAYLLSNEPRLPAAMDHMPPRAEVYAIALDFDKPPTVAQVRAEVRRGSDKSDIAVIVEQRGTRWVVTQIIE